MGHNGRVRVRRLLSGLMATVGLLACSSDRTVLPPTAVPAPIVSAATSSSVNSSVVTTTSIAAMSIALDVGVKAEAVALAAAAEKARRQAGASANCATPPATNQVAEQAQSNCDDLAGWRMFAWIGESGDGIVRVERLRGSAWVPVFHGPLCLSGVAAATPEQLARFGVPLGLADAWGYPASACQP